MAKYACFFCHLDITVDNLPTDRCPNCGRTYEFPLRNKPERIRNYILEEALGRGYYGATFRATLQPIGRECVLKLVPKDVYAQRKDHDFVKECQEHYKIAAKSQHLVKINDSFEETVSFGEAGPIDCYVADLEFIAGQTLEDFSESAEKSTPNTVAQIACDLFALLDELAVRVWHHNDLHSRNVMIRKLSREEVRADAIDPKIRVVAVDLAAGDDIDKSDPDRGRLGDQHQVAAHLRMLVRRLDRNREGMLDLDYRLTGLLRDLSTWLAASPTSGSSPSYKDLAGLVRSIFDFSQSPWERPASLHSFDQGRNAQWLEPAWIPTLLVDPEGWVGQVGTSGPQLIVGIRGCGKTMLMRSLQFQSRVTKHRDDHIGDRPATLRWLHDDGYIGLYVACNQVFVEDRHNPSDLDRKPLRHVFERLFVAYAQEALRALRQLRSMAREDDVRLDSDFDLHIVKAVAQCLAGMDDLAGPISSFEAERRLVDVSGALTRAADSTTAHYLKYSPAEAFAILADAIRASAEIWGGSTVLFLLDDVSTRYLGLDTVASLLGQLLFKHERCAFKITTEQQTYQLDLPSMLRGRDYGVFDLGVRVRSALRNDQGQQPTFVEKVLANRASYYGTQSMVAYTPSRLLGDAPLSEIAAAAGRGTTPIYYGISALSSVCVGDIGDAIYIYNEMLASWNKRDDRIPQQVQSEIFIDSSNRAAYPLVRRNRDLSRFAYGFARAAHLLLEGSVTKRRPMELSRMVIRMSSDEAVELQDDIRDLVDAAVFILDSQDGLTVRQQRKGEIVLSLAFRKLLGLSRKIGLDETHEFILDGEAFKSWLQSGGGDDSILVEKAKHARVNGDHARSSSTRRRANSSGSHRSPTQTTVDDALTAVRDKELSPRSWTGPRVHVAVVPLESLGTSQVQTVVLGLGSEDRTPVSAHRLFERIHPELTVLVRYPEDDHVDEIRAAALSHSDYIAEHGYERFLGFGQQLPSVGHGPALVDVSGLSQPIIFHSIRSYLSAQGAVYVAYTEATIHRPKDDEIEPILRNMSGVGVELLAELKAVWPGEPTDYTYVPMIQATRDPSRPRFLLAPATAKHERLLSLLEWTSFDRLEVFAPPVREGPSNRRRLAQMAARWACRAVDASRITELETDDLQGTIDTVLAREAEFQIGAGMSFELGVIGSKLQAVAMAAASCAGRVDQAWYVRAGAFDQRQFTEGCGRTRVFRLSLVDY